MTAGDILAAFADRSLSVALLIAIVLLIRKPFARAFGPQAAYLLWGAPVIRLVMPALNVLPRPEEHAAAAPQYVIRYAAAAETNVAPALAEPAVNMEIGAFAVAAALIVWLLVTFAIIGYGADEFWRQRNDRMRKSRPAPAAIVASARRIAKSFNLKTPPRIRVSEDDNGPFVAGFFNPIIFLPRGFERNYSVQQQNFVLTHEIAHVARGDLIALGGAYFMRALQWPNPLAHVALGAFRVDQEAACDATVLRRFDTEDSRSSYLETILHSVRAGRAEPAHGLSFNHPLKERLMYLKSTPPGKLRALAGAGLSVMLVAGGLLATAEYGYAAEKTTARAEFLAPAAPVAPVAEVAPSPDTVVAPATAVSPNAPSEPAVLVAPVSSVTTVAPSAPTPVIAAATATPPTPVRLAARVKPSQPAPAPDAPTELIPVEELDGAYFIEIDSDELGVDTVEGIDGAWEFNALKDGFAFKDFEEAFDTAFADGNFEFDMPDFDFEFFSLDDGEGYAVITGDVDENGKRSRVLSFRGNLADIEKCLNDANEKPGKKSSRKGGKDDDKEIVCVNGIHKYELKAERDALGKALERMRLSFKQNEGVHREEIAEHLERAKESLRAQQKRIEAELQRLDEQQALAEAERGRAERDIERAERERERALERAERDRERAERERERALARAEREREEAMDRALERAEQERDDRD